MGEPHPDRHRSAVAGCRLTLGLRSPKPRPLHACLLVALGLCVMEAEAAGQESTVIPAAARHEAGPAVPFDVSTPQTPGARSERAASSQPLDIEAALDALARRLAAALPLGAEGDRYALRIDLITLEGRPRVPDESPGASQATVTESQDMLGVFIETALAAKLVSTGVVVLSSDAGSYVSGSYWLGGSDTILVRVFLVDAQGHTVAAASQAVQTATIAERYLRHVNQLRAGGLVMRNSAQGDPARVTVTPPPPAGPPGGTNDDGSARIVDSPPPPVPPAMVARDGQDRATLRAVRLDAPLIVDGRLDDRVYDTVPAVGGFIQQEPDEGEPATEATDVWVFFDDQNVYISARCWDSQPWRIVTNELRRGNVGIARGDNLTVVLDTFYDRRNGYFFQTNPMGGVYDSLVTDERTENIDWDTFWEVQSARFDQGWSVEIAIPFKSLRYAGAGEQVWGINFRRIVEWKNEMSYLNPALASYARVAIMKFSSAATLVGLEAPSTSTNLELKPYGISQVTTDAAATPALSNELTGDWGFDAKYGLTRGLIADFTYNTDFAQVEVDEQQVNLTRFNLFFPEKRQFFLEGRDIFSFGGTSPRFSGLTPAGDAPIIFFSRRIGLSEGRSIPILGGGRVTGRAGPYTIGALSIQTDDDLEIGVEETNFSVLRLKRNVFSRSTIGVIGTHRSQSLEGPGSNQAFGVDGAFAFFSNLFIDTYYARTRTDDQSDHDTSYRANLENRGDRYGFEYEHLRVERNFNPEIGFMRRRDFRRHFGKLQFTPRPAANGVVRKYRFEGSFDHFTGDSTGLLETREAKARFGIDFQNSDRWTLDYTQQFELLTEPFEISPGVTIPVGGYSFEDVRTTYTIGAGKQHGISGRVSARTGSFFTGDRTDVGYTGRVRLSSRLAFEPRISTNFIALSEGSFTTHIVGVRAIYTMSPRMFVEALTQFNSSADSLGVNIRYRWEYTPGSDLFVVYTEGRDTESDPVPRLENRGLAIKFTKLFRF
ncbi:MAG: hypothetical protein CL471_07940 [Acidobacteria bacterium]|nr:hypothetical protein [Acidobacteriota bacterium]